MILVDADRAEHVPDAHLVALTIEYGLTLQTTDRAGISPASAP